MYLIFDVETSDKPPKSDTDPRDIIKWPRLVQLGFALFDPKRNLIKEYNQIIKPNNKFIIAEGAYNVHKINNVRAEKEGIDIVQAFDAFYDAVEKAEYLVAHNSTFDHGLMNSEHIRNKIKRKPIKKERTVFCTMKSTISLCKLPFKNSHYKYSRHYKYPSLIELHEFLFGYKFEDAHNAIIDVRATTQCFWELIDREIILSDHENIYRKKLTL